MNKFAIAFLTAAFTLTSGAALAATGTGSDNAAADAGAVAPSAKEHVQPNGVDNSKINTGSMGTPATGSTMTGTDHEMSASEMHKNTECKDGKCPDMNNKVGDDANHKTDGTTH